MSDTDRASAPLLKMLRDWIKKKGLNTAAAATAMGIDRSRARRVLSGADAMTVDELLALGGLLELSPDDLALPGLAEVEDPGPQLPRVVQMGAMEIDEFVLDPYGNHPEQLFRAAFELGCDFMFFVSTKEIKDSGVPASVLERYGDKDLNIKLDAAYHLHNNPSYGEHDITLTLSFDALYTCTFPWSSFRQILFFPVVPDPVHDEEEPEPPSPSGGRPTLRLVT